MTKLKIEMPADIPAKYRKKWIKISNVLRSSLGIPIKMVTKTGAIVKQTTTRKSDLDIGFVASTNVSKPDLLVSVEKTMTNTFGKVAHIHASSNAVHVDFLEHDKLKVDAVPMTKEHLVKEKELDGQIYQLSGEKKKAIRVVKMTLDSIFGELVKSYEVESAVKQSKKNDLKQLIRHGINFFRGRIEKKGYSVECVYGTAMHYIK